MAIYQPSQVVPDVRSGLGLGVIDATEGMSVSWRVNGPSAMVAFQIDLYDNDSGSTALYSTGKLTDGCPFYGTSSTGEALFFSYEIEAAALSGAGIVNGNEYKLLITQWWSAADSVSQSSASVFVTRATPVLGIAAIGTAGVIDTRSYSFTGSYSQAQGDVLNWFRWQIATVVDGSTGATLLDSGNVSGTMDISCAYDGFFAGAEYAIRLTAQTENGVEADTGWVYFTAQYETIDIGGAIQAGCVGGTDAVLVEWSDIGIIPGTAIGPYSIENAILTLPKYSMIWWTKTGTKDMSFAAPWSLVWKATLGFEDALAFAVVQEDDSEITLRYDIETHSLILENEGGTALVTQTGIINAPTVTAVLTPTTLYLRCEYMTGGLYPSESLYPGDTVYPREDTVEQVDTYTLPVSYTQSAVVGVTIGGYQECAFIELINGAASTETVTAAITNGVYTPGEYDDDYMMADWTSGIDAGQLSIGDKVIGWDVYRRLQGGASLTKIGRVDATTGTVYDYGAASGGGAYEYYLFPIGQSTYITTAITSNLISPCWASWSLMECAATDDPHIFTVLTAWRFRLNVTTGAVSNNNKPGVLENFTPYPKVQLVPQNYKSGSLTAPIGAVVWTDGQPEYRDSAALANALYGLSVTQNALFLKNRKGELLRVRITGISMQTEDATPEQLQSMSLSWVEVGSAEGVSLYATAYAGAQEQEGGVQVPQVVDTSDGTATEQDIRLGMVAYSQGKRLVGVIPNGDNVGF